MTFSEINKDNFYQAMGIYQEGINTGLATFETNIPSYEKWDESHLLYGRVAMFNATSMLGWAALSKVSDRCVYNGVAEVSVYVSTSHQGIGIGTQLIKKLIQTSEDNGIWTLQCGIMTDNKPSIQLHLKCGFREIGYREKVGQLHGIWKDNTIMERRSKTIGI